MRNPSLLLLIVVFILAPFKLSAAQIRLLSAKPGFLC